MNDVFVNYEIALLLKKKGFDEICYAEYNGYGNLILSNTEYPLTKNSDILCDDNWLMAVEKLGLEQKVEDLCTAPMWLDVILWFVKVHKINITINFFSDKWGWDVYNMRYKIRNNSGYKYASYMEAMEKGILKSVKSL